MARTFKSSEVEPSSSLAQFDLPVGRPVAVYYRQSTDGQIGNISTSMQTVDMVAEMKRRGWKAEDIYLIDADAGVSGTKKIDERVGMRELFQLITDGTIGTVACVDEDRLFRDVTQIQVNIFIEACKQAKVQVVTPSIVYVFHHPTMGDFYRQQFRFKSEMAAQYLNFLNGRLGKARERLMREGKWAGTRIPTGFMVDIRPKLANGSTNPDYRKFVPFEPFAEIVREIFRVYVETGGNEYRARLTLLERGLLFPDIDDCLPPTGFKASYQKKNKLTGRIPSKAGIRAMVTNPAYAGHWMFHSAVTHWHNHAAIVPEDLFYRAFNLASEVGLDGNKNPHYRGMKANARPSKEAARNVEAEKAEGMPGGGVRSIGMDTGRADDLRPVFEGFIRIFIDDEWRKLGTRYSPRSKRYDYVHNEEPGRHDYRTTWRRDARYIDEAILHVFGKRLLATITSWNDHDNPLGNSGAAKQARAQEQRRVEKQIQALERTMEDIISNLGSLRLPDLIAKMEQQYEQSKDEHARLTAQLEQTEADAIDGEQLRENLLRAFLDPKRPFNGTAYGELYGNLDLLWAGLTRDEIRTYARYYIERVEIPEFKPLSDAQFVIYWRDNTSSAITVRRKSNEGYVWSFAELDAINELVSRGASQLEIAAALPSRKWDNIRRQIRLQFGIGIETPAPYGPNKLESYNEYRARTEESAGQGLSGVAQSELLPELSPMPLLYP